MTRHNTLKHGRHNPYPNPRQLRFLRLRLTQAQSILAFMDQAFEEITPARQRRIEHAREQVQALAHTYKRYTQ